MLFPPPLGVFVRVSRCDELPQLTKR